MRYHFSIDRGGTFTDCILLDKQTGERSVTKVLSKDDAPLIAMRELLGLNPGQPIPPSDLRLGTTIATNALLERTGARTALVITEGFSDLLLIGDQTRPELFELQIQKSKPLPELFLELSSRLDPNGKELSRASDEELRSLVQRLVSAEIEALALVVLHAYAAPEVEVALRKRIVSFWPRDRRSIPIIISSEAAPEQGLLGRASTATVEAYTAPLIKKYLENLGRELPGSRIRFMQSSGGLAGPDRFRGPSAVLSGPAGGIVASEIIAKEAGSHRLISFDMGGTSTDVALIEGKAQLRFEKTVAGVPLYAPLLDIHTVAAGGGSVCEFDGYGLVVGPKSVGADPGPLCYSRPVVTRGESPDVATATEGQLALTDINLALGRLTEDHFPFPLDPSSGREALDSLCQIIQRKSGELLSVEQLARGFAAVATGNMAEAIRRVTIQRGVDLDNTDLLVFGGAAGQHACALARALGIKRIIAHRLAGVLSAYGIGQAEQLWTGEYDAARVELGKSSLSLLAARFEQLRDDGTEAIERETPQGTDSGSLLAHEKRTLALRYRGTESCLSIPWGSLEKMTLRFESEHQQHFGFVRPGALIEVVATRLSLSLSSSGEHKYVAPPKQAPPQRKVPALPIKHLRVHLDRRSVERVPVYELSDLVEEQLISAPALLIDPTGTFLIDDGFEAHIRGELLFIERKALADDFNEEVPLFDAARVQIAATRFSAIAEQMGEALRRSASSTNIRDRLDFSCALFDPQGRLVANAPHIPVHLGAMSESVTAIMKAHPTMTPGTSYVTNDPAMGGSHLPDITVVSPVFDKNGHLQCFTASRGHHADIGGITPGSMPAFSRSLNEEGVVLSAECLSSDGHFHEQAIRKLLAAGPYPARNPDENLADLNAQLAANQLGAKLTLAYLHEQEPSGLVPLMDKVRSLSALWMGDAIEALPDGQRRFSDCLDDGSPICVAIEISGRKMRLDFSGVGPESPSNLNAPRAVTLSCVLYALRTLLHRPIPLNQGCLEAVELYIPPRSLLNPAPHCAVAGGNVETSQRVVDVILAALGCAAASQGSMNNFSFGNDSFAYYETIGGGAGAGPSYDGASAVQTHMTNTRITDVEILEERFPVRVHEFSIRRGSGGDGLHQGGNGIIRELQSLEPLRISLLTQRRQRAPFGLEGGGPGSVGKNLVAGKGVDGCYTAQLSAGIRIRIETPGGGGFGRRIQNK